MELTGIESYSPKEYIIIKNARVHNLKHLDIALPRNKFIVITGLSGSGKSSLAFDTLYAEGQRRYIESLSAYARQFLGRMPKPEVDYIKGISPAIAIEQKVKTHNPRSTVGTSTEIYDYLKLLFARIGTTCSPVSGNKVKKDSITDVVDFVLGCTQGTMVFIECPVHFNKERSVEEHLKTLQQQGFNRLDVQGDIVTIDTLLEKGKKISTKTQINLVLDRVMINEDTVNSRDRIADSVQTAFYEGAGQCIIITSQSEEKKKTIFSDKYELDGIVFEEPSVNLFTFNNPYGACKVCEGFGSIIGIDEDLVVPNKSLSVYEEAIACWKGEKMGEWKDQLVKNAYKFDFPIHKPYIELSEEHKELLWKGNEFFGGINEFFKYVESQTYKIQYRVMLARYRGKTICPDCRGTRLRKDASYVKVAGKSIIDIVLMPVKEALRFFRTISLSDYENQVAKRILIELTTRLQFLSDVGLGYLTLNRASNTLSGGESQRINLATALGSSLVGSMYILDEPSIGLHPRDTEKLISVLKRLRDIGNSVIVVEHDEEIIKASDQIVDIGPLAGMHGGELIFQGSYEELLQFPDSLTSKYLNKVTSIPVPHFRRPWKKFIEICGAHENNLKNICVKFPLNILTVATGVSGSGKTTLVKQTLYSSLRKIYGGYSEKTGKHIKLNGNIDNIGNIEYVDQNPIGKSSRSNPVTYIKAYDDIRSLFAEQQLAKLRGFKPGYFSFNIPGGRCEECQGDGYVTIEMQFMADISLTCESCGGKRFKDEVLDITWNGKNINEVLDMTIEQAIIFFNGGSKQHNAGATIANKLQPLVDVGLGYIKLGQPSSTLSGGEAQRLKLASFLLKGSMDKPTMFIFDEPTTGLHFHDIHKLYDAFNALIDKGHTIIVIEHNMELIKCADWLIDLGPEGGNEGGYVVFEGTPEDMLGCKKSYTAKFLKEKLQ
ncbi:MAG TPA: excinuclease ABC subunit UvrA [Bacteroidales bacterium]|nr:excinuclease ABC subunit UvrA [Bacteroidales bacterium]HPB25383.1 excinuclease ABC subunit UvrA [Bacteroidales bacterium]HPI29351.1 excinuclease ABC subunit UvrA [Bacteroidales bacterium]HQN16818.1 excinuclease ABC subunit UvrA [Bacteroidales bacterium]HQP15010.1 excinuclease ABC subunit UvrA [Bacteroidales bacterium]